MGRRRAEGRQSRQKKLFLGCRETLEACGLGLALVWHGPRKVTEKRLEEWVAIGDGNSVNEHRCHSQISGASETGFSSE